MIKLAFIFLFLFSCSSPQTEEYNHYDKAKNAEDRFNKLYKELDSQ